MRNHKYQPEPLAWEALRRRPGDLETICRALAPPTQNRACAAFLKWLLRVWNTRTLRLDKHLSGEWKFASHKQLVAWGAATSVRNAERVLRLLSEWQPERENADLIEKRKAHLGADRNKMHLCPTSHFLAIMDTLAACYNLMPDKKTWSEFLVHVCRPIDDATREQDSQTHTTELQRIARKIRRDREYGKLARTVDLANVKSVAAAWVKDKSTAKMADKGGGSTAKMAVHLDESPAKMAVADLETGKPLETGELETGKCSTNTQEQFQGSLQEEFLSGGKKESPPTAPQEPPLHYNPANGKYLHMTLEEFEAAIAED